jgi:hypothetical protein
VVKIYLAGSEQIKSRLFSCDATYEQFSSLAVASHSEKYSELFALELYLITIILKRMRVMRTWWFISVLLCSAQAACAFASVQIPAFEPRSVQASAESEACKKELQQIDTEVQKLRVQKQKHVDLARQYQAEGDRWQYSTGRIDDAHASWGKADDERAKAIALQLQIDQLLEKKNLIYQFYPELQYE